MKRARFTALAASFSMLLCSGLSLADSGSSVGGIGRVSELLGSKVLSCAPASAGAAGIELGVKRLQDGKLEPVFRDRGLLDRPLTKVNAVQLEGEASNGKLTVQLVNERDASDADALKISVKDLEAMSSQVDLERPALLIRQARGGSPDLLKCRVR